MKLPTLPKLHFVVFVLKSTPVKVGKTPLPFTIRCDNHNSILLFSRFNVPCHRKISILVSTTSSRCWRFSGRRRIQSATTTCQRSAERVGMKNWRKRLLLSKWRMLVSTTTFALSKGGYAPLWTQMCRSPFLREHRSLCRDGVIPRSIFRTGLCSFLIRKLTLMR